MEWWREYYQNDENRINNLGDEEVEKISLNYSADGGGSETIVKFIKSNLKIREEIYKKIVQGRPNS